MLQIKEYADDNYVISVDTENVKFFGVFKRTETKVEDLEELEKGFTLTIDQK